MAKLLQNHKLFSGTLRIHDNKIYVKIGGYWRVLIKGKSSIYSNLVFKDDLAIVDRDMHWGAKKLYADKMCIRTVGDEFVIARLICGIPDNTSVCIASSELLNKGCMCDNGMDGVTWSEYTQSETEELDRQIVWLEPNFEIVKENKNESSN